MPRRDPDTWRLLAAEYVLGLLRGRARERFERMAAAERDLAREVEGWEQRLGALAEAAPAVEPPARVWRAIEASTRPPAMRTGLWDRVQFWRGFGLAAAAAALALAFVFIVTPRTPEMPAATHVAVLNDADAEPAWLVRADLADKMISITPLKASAIPSGKALELWLIAGEGQAPVSLGLVPEKGRASVSLASVPAALLGEAKAFAVSLEPPGGSPTKLPTGPILYQGRLVKAEL